jgi:inositol phosphorylceramide mannosyltransferase catalytic subunit
VIPRIIHQTYKEWDAIPTVFKRSIDKLKNNNKEWEYRFYSDENVEKYISHYYGQNHLRIYRCINPDYGAVRADFFRYLVMYRHGGVYLDIKSACTLPLDQFRDDSYILSHWENPLYGVHDVLPGGEFMQCFIIAEPYHVYLATVIEAVSKNISSFPRGIGRDAVLKITGPIAYTKAILSVLDSTKHRIVKCERDCGFVYQVANHMPIMGLHYSALRTSVITGY